MEKPEPKMGVGLGAGKAIRKKCLDCCCGDMKYIKVCPSLTCPLWMYRFGKNPHIGGRAIVNPFLIKENFVGKELLSPNDAHAAIVEIAAKAGVVVEDDKEESEEDTS